ncbi:hypothetical protein AXK56_06850 [Tsukamurella pulmonis]|uniref:Uncharacterized protein n=1 Tax=Tsukamurella pulmonis TaxID=47312 RepID=A0A1H1CJY3_9ACTN|nr:hypothetical protein [Tsukamurella pulmonis]KXO89866.1 hypothetical protein AXK56_06850 [Tsukamurella pulmonis]SDQ64541.1 hypothetical protein SAMN04489765_1246 [Tsukamurella pulmonis]SUP23602.1 Uncharacterised protein [Tsukamurella pulmonis]
MELKRNPIIATLARRFAVTLLLTGTGAAVFAAGPASAQPSDHVVRPAVVQPGGAAGGNHGNVPPAAGLWPGNMNPDARTSSDTGPASAAPSDPADHPREAPGVDSPRF